MKPDTVLDRKESNSDRFSGWYHEWFDDRYLTVYGHRDFSEASRFVDKWPFLDKIGPKDWCLDLGCGNGRYSYAIASKGINVLGIDLSDSMLNSASTNRNDREPKAARVCFVRADMRHIPAQPRFSLVVSLFTSFGYFDDLTNLGVLQRAAALLIPGGIFVLDIACPEYVEKTIAAIPVSRRVMNGIKIEEERSLDHNLKRVNKVIRIDDSYGQSQYRESVRLYSSDEVLEMFDTCGLSIGYGIWGNYNGNPPGDEGPRQIYFGVKNA